MADPGSRRAASLVVLATLSLACAHFEMNEPLRQWDPEVRSTRSTRAPGDAVVIVAFSGGGTRAAAFAYGVLEELAATRGPEGAKRLLDEVDLVSGVSGGSFTAAYYGLHGDGIFEHFEERFLRRDVQAGLLWRVLSPLNWVRMLSPRYSRSEVAARYFAGTIFDEAELGAFSGPEIVINATDLGIGVPFEFSQRQFDFICSNASTFDVGRAVAASSAVPGLFAPLPLRNYAGTCGFEPPPWFDEALRSREPSPRRRSRARAQSSYLDAARRRYVHLVDGGVSDNLAIRSIFDDVLLRGDPMGSVGELGYEEVGQVVIILVNAQRQPDLTMEDEGIIPSLWQMLNATSGAQIARYNFETIELVRHGFELWTREMKGPAGPPAFHLVEVSFDAMVDPQERRYLNDLPTSLTLPAEDVDRLRRAGRQLLRTSPSYQAVLRDMAWPATATPQETAPRQEADLR